MFHQSIKYSSTPIEYAFTDKLLYTRIAKESGQTKTLEVFEKNQEIIQDSLSVGELSAVKHANGKDWWIIQPRRNSNQFYVFLFTKDGVVDTLLQTIGDPSPPEKEGYGQTTFSTFGDKMVRYYPDNPIRLYGFDRSTGLFTDYQTFILDTGNTIDFDGGVAFLLVVNIYI
ncbi:MAG: hypothetical protein R2778_04225 [Saprospiraceae bacterium]